MVEVHIPLQAQLRRHKWVIQVSANVRTFMKRMIAMKTFQVQQGDSYARAVGHDVPQGGRGCRVEPTNRRLWTRVSC